MLEQQYSTDMPRPILQIQRTGLGLFFGALLLSLFSLSAAQFLSAGTARRSLPSSIS